MLVRVMSTEKTLAFSVIAGAIWNSSYPFQRLSIAIQDFNAVAIRGRSTSAKPVDYKLI